MLPLTDGAPIRLLIVDDHEVVRIGLRTLFVAARRFDVVGEAATVADAVRLARSCRPDVVLMDVRLPDGSGVDACRQIRSEQPALPVVMLTSYAAEEAVLASVLGGADGYLLKHNTPARLVEAVETVARGGSLLDPAITRTVLQWIQRQAQSTHADRFAQGGITEQERRILSLISEGRTNREIGIALSLSERTIKTYVSKILQKLHLTRRSEAAAFMARGPESPLADA